MILRSTTIEWAPERGICVLSLFVACRSREEAGSQHAFDLLAQSLESEIASGNKQMSEKKMQVSKSQEVVATSGAELDNTNRVIQETLKYLTEVETTSPALAFCGWALLVGGAWWAFDLSILITDMVCLRCFELLGGSQCIFRCFLICRYFVRRV